MNLNVDITNYMGKLDDGILILININFDKKFYEGVFFYSDNDLHITVDDLLEEKIGVEIENWNRYKELLECVLKKLVPCSEIYDTLDYVNFENYISIKNKNRNIVTDEVNPDEIIVATQSNLPQ